IGNKWIMIPRLSKKNYANPSRFYFFAGLMEQPVKQFRGNIPVLPTARRELTEETGIPQNQIEIVGPGLKKTSSKKARALVSVHSAESKSPGQDLIWLGRAKTKDPKGFLKRFFVQRSDGEWVPKKAKDQWEIGGGQLVEQSSQALHEFLETHKHEIASVALVALKALEMELKKNGR
ncbi:hypothetical protein KJ972_01060, partial [Candidatus Micrarchaeota archaeon]|nr:hypothetical protein [Candidatus Micrarchaeota archaeon]